MSKDIKDYGFVHRLKSLSFIDEIWLFGSRARGDNEERSDIDLAIICPNANDADWLAVLDILEDADTLLKIDCIRFDALQRDDLLRLNILRFQQVIYKKL